MNLENWLTHSTYEPNLPKYPKSRLIFPESLSTCKISGWLTSPFLRNCCFNLTGIEYFWPHQILNFKITFYLPSIYIFILKIKLIDQIAPEIWLIYESYSLIGQEHSHPGNKIKFIDQFLLEIELIQEFHNLIGWQHFLPYPI